MSAEIINLRRLRKARARTGKEVEAEENRRRHGLTKAEKQAERDRQDRAARHLDGHRRTPEDEPGST